MGEQGLGQIAVVGGNIECGPEDDPCNGPLAPGSNYAVRYRLYSGEEFTDYDFSDATFSTGEFRNTYIFYALCLVWGL